MPRSHRPGHLHLARSASATACSLKKSLEFQGFQILPEFVPQVGPAQSKLHRGFQEAELVAAVIACTFEHVGIDRLLFEKHANAVGKLNFSAAAHAGFIED